MPVVAVFINDEGIACEPLEHAVCRLYRQGPDACWEEESAFSVEIDVEKGLAAVRGAFGALALRLKEAGVEAVAGREVSGVAYNRLDAAGFAVFEMKGRPERFLDYIALRLEQNETAAAAAGRTPASPQPYGDPGCFRLDLAELAEKRPDVSSKMAVVPFLQNAEFAELRVVCAHIPPWFERSLGEMGFTFEPSALSNGKLLVRIFPARGGRTAE